MLLKMVSLNNMDSCVTTPITLRVKNSVLEAFKADGKGYQTRMNAVLEAYVKATKKAG